MQRPNELIFPVSIPQIDTEGRDVVEFLLENYISKNPWLQSMYEYNPINAFIFAHRYQLYKERALDKGNTTVYYPGIGGGDQPIDPISAFIETDADTVYGVDLRNGREDIKDFEWAVSGLKSYRVENIEIDDSDPIIWRATFDYNSRKRTLIINKGSINVKNEIVDYPNMEIGPLVFSRGTATLLNHLPQEMESRVKILMIGDDNTYTPTEVKVYWERKGFRAIDNHELGEFFKTKFSVQGQVPSKSSDNHIYVLVKG